MSAQVSPDATSDDKLWSLLSYIFSPLIPIIVLLMEDKKSRPFIKYHAVQALVLGVVELVIAIFLGWTVILACVPLLIFIYLIYLGIQAYQGKMVVVPVVTNFVKNQGWV
jgi:uncharacterized membrane protein